MRKLIVLLFILKAISFFSQSHRSTEASNQMLRNIQTFYTDLNDIKTEVNRLETIINGIDTEKLTRRWVDRKEFIFNIFRVSARGIESSIDVLPTIDDQAKQLIWSGKIQNMINELNNEISKGKESGGSLMKLLDDVEENTIVFNKENLRLLSYDDLMYYLNKRTGRSNSEIVTEAKKRGYNNTRDYMNELALRFMQ